MKVSTEDLDVLQENIGKIKKMTFDEDGNVRTIEFKEEPLVTMTEHSGPSDEEMEEDIEKIAEEYEKASKDWDDEHTFSPTKPYYYPDSLDPYPWYDPLTYIGTF